MRMNEAQSQISLGPDGQTTANHCGAQEHYSRSPEYHIGDGYERKHKSTCRRQQSCVHGPRELAGRSAAE
ncbi:hypothetical protein D9M69_82120 [compost metagenome]